MKRNAVASIGLRPEEGASLRRRAAVAGRLSLALQVAEGFTNGDAISCPGDATAVGHEFADASFEHWVAAFRCGVGHAATWRLTGALVAKAVAAIFIAAACGAEREAALIRGACRPIAALIGRPARPAARRTGLAFTLIAGPAAAIGREHAILAVRVAGAAFPIAAR